MSRRGEIRKVSVIAPMLNEAAHVAGLVDDIAAQEFEREIEFIVADGGSTDGSVVRLRSAAAAHGLEVTVLPNPDRCVSHGLNACIRSASGDLIVRVDCHSRYATDYVCRCVEASEETGAENVGGTLIPRGRTPVERAVAAAMTTPFGGIQWTRHGSDGRAEVDTVPYGAFRRDVFRDVGLFDERLVRNQDDEFNLRLRRAGGRVVRDPAIRTFYTPRGSYRALFRQYFEYGVWKPAVMWKHRQIVSARSLVPALFVLTILVLKPLAPLVVEAAMLLGLILGAYATGALFFGVRAVRKSGESWRLLPRVLAVFPTFHIAYGVGMLVGTFRTLRVAVAARRAPAQDPA